LAERALRDQGPIRCRRSYRTLLPDYHFTVVYDAIGAEQPEALAYIALEFFERRDLFLVSRESDGFFPCRRSSRRSNSIPESGTSCALRR
jgi:hypothetical protein